MWSDELKCAVMKDCFCSMPNDRLSSGGNKQL